MGIAQWFTGFCTDLNIKNNDVISTRYKNITKRLNTDFWYSNSETSHSLYAGSYGRNTAINGFSDLDMIFQLPFSEYQKYNGYLSNGQSALLQAVKASIERTYSATSIRGDGQVVQVFFGDGVIFEVVPAFCNDDDSYTYPDANNGGSWKTTNPKPEISAIRTRNILSNYNLKRLCHMARSWKKEWDVPIGGLLIDTLAYQFIDDWAHKNESYFYYDFLSRDFFKWMSEQDSEQVYWRAPGSSQYVYGKELFQYKAKRCYNISLEAIEHQSADRDWSAKQKWREIYGTTFPS